MSVENIPALYHSSFLFYSLPLFSRFPMSALRFIHMIIFLVLVFDIYINIVHFTLNIHIEQATMMLLSSVSV